MDQFALTWLHLPLSTSISCFHVYRDVCERELVERHRLPAPGSFPTVHLSRGPQASAGNLSPQRLNSPLTVYLPHTSSHCLPGLCAPTVK